MSLAEKKKVKAINAILVKTGQFENKADIIRNATGNRTTHSSELTDQEANALLTALQRGMKTKTAVKQPSQKMTNKLFAMAHEMGWIKTSAVITPEGIKEKKDFSRVHAWVLKYGWKKQPLSGYSYEELPKLVSIFEFKVYKSYIANPKTP